MYSKGSYQSPSTQLFIHVNKINRLNSIKGPLLAILTSATFIHISATDPLQPKPLS
jgi:hypothetical protein